jgi:hypothetical protein
MFTGELAESRQTEVTIRDIDEVAMELLIDFCYTSHIVVEEGNVQTLLPAGELEYGDVIIGTWSFSQIYILPTPKLRHKNWLKSGVFHFKLKIINEVKKA